MGFTTSSTSGPLTGLRVIELGSLIAGPFAGRMLADLGAEVIKVESPRRPDAMRDWGHAAHKGRKLWWPSITRNKKLVTLDLATRAGRGLLLDLASSTDAIVENFRPGTLERWGLGFDRLLEANPALILVRVSGYGQTGPYASRPGFAAAAEALAGLRYISGYPGEVPPRMGISLGDSLAGMFAVQGLLAALHRRGGDGDGEVVNVSIVESCLALTESIAAEYDVLGLVREPGGARLPGIAPSNVFQARDGRQVVIAANHDTLFERLCQVMGREDLARDSRFADHRARGDHAEVLEHEIQAWAARHDAAEIDELLAGAGVVCAPVASIADVFANPQVRAREMLVAHDDPELGTFLAPGVVPRFSGGSGEVRWSGRWQLGADNAEILGERLGLSEDELADLRQAGAI